jgi:hypothetical protein
MGMAKDAIFSSCSVCPDLVNCKEGFNFFQFIFRGGQRRERARITPVLEDYDRAKVVIKFNLEFNPAHTIIILFSFVEFDRTNLTFSLKMKIIHLI